MTFILLQNVIPQTVVPEGKPVRKVFKADPQRATMLAVTFPGLGQIYNRSYWKIPLVYAGFGGIIYAAGFNGSNYNTFMKAYQDFVDKVPETASYLTLEGLKDVDPSTYDPVLYPETASTSSAEWYKERMLKQIDYYRKYRDLSYIGIGLWYVFSVLDANVDASLYNYDIIDNLDLTITPNQIQTLNSPAFGINVSLRYTF
jgi:hypothetical protein